MFSEPTIAVVVAAFNASATIERCISSIACQSYPVTQLVVVDDGSRDSTSDIVKAFTATVMPSAEMVVLRENRGVSAARNAGLDRVRCDLVTFVDSDDWIERDHVSSLVQAKLNFDVRVVGVQRPVVIEPEGDAGRVPVAQLREDLVRLRRPVSVWAYLLEFSLIGAHRFDESVSIFEDLQFLLSVLPRQGLDVAVVDIWSYRYEIGNQSVNRSGYSPKWLALLDMARWIATECESREAVMVFRAHVVNILLFIMSKCSVRATNEEFRRVQKEARVVLRSRALLTGHVSPRRSALVLLASLSARDTTRLLSALRRMSRLLRGRAAV